MSPFVETEGGTDRVTMNLGGGHVPTVPSAICAPALRENVYQTKTERAVGSFLGGDPEVRHPLSSSFIAYIYLFTSGDRF